MKKLKYICYCILFFTFLGCNENKNIEIESIYILFYNYSFESFFPIDCNDIKKAEPSMKTYPIENETGDSIGLFVEKQGVLDTTITDSYVLRDIQKELKATKFDTINASIDARISCVIKYKNGMEEQLCIGGYLADEIMYKGFFLKRNNKLLYLIKQNIGYYLWMGDRIMEYSDELHDSSFKRERVKSYSGKEY